MSLASGAVLGAYEVTGSLGAGGMGEVFRARDRKLQRDVALKILPAAFAADAERRARFAREAQLLASLNHPNIAAIYGVEDEPAASADSGAPRHALVLELVEGPTLAERLARGALPLDEVLAIARQMAAALDAAHQAGVVHRDLKPSNIKVRADGTVKVLDFGLAKALDPTGSPAAGSELLTSPAMTRAGIVLGTAAYMAPEQARGLAADKRSDIWGFGCVLFEMLAGKRAFEGTDSTDTMAAILRTEPNWNALPAELPTALQTLLRRCLAKDPARRLRDIGDARFELDELQDTAAETASAAHGSGAARRAWAWGLAGLVLGLTAAGAAVLFMREPATDATPMRLAVVAPAGTAFAERDITGHPQFALSPDGSRIAFVAARRGERAQLWVRSLESGVAQPLLGTEDVSGPFWSPDGRSLGFFARGKLKRIAVGGGAVQELADVAVDVASGSWNERDVILFAPATGAGLFRVPAGGGPVSRVTTLGEAETGHRWPQFLPDGRRFLLYVRGAQRGVYLGDLDTGEKTFVLESGANAVYAPPGRLLFERGGNLTSQQFDVESAALIGQPEALGDPISSLGGPSYLPVSVAHNGWLAYWNGPPSMTRLEWLDRGGRPLGAIELPSRSDGPLLSPDATRVLVTQRIDNNRTDLWRIDLASGLTSQLTFGQGVARFGVWSADGESVLFAVAVPGSTTLLRKAASGAGPETVVDGMGVHYAVFAEDVSSDGRWMLYTATTVTGWDIFGLDSASAASRPVIATPANEIQARLSPDGVWVAYASDESGAWEVYVQAFPEGTGKWRISSGGGSQPVWRGDGRELFYVAADGRLIAVPIGTDAGFEPGQAAALFQTRVPPMLTPFRHGYTVSPDGERFLLNNLVPDREPAVITIVRNWQTALE